MAKELSLLNEAQEEVIKELVSGTIPKIVPFLKPGLEELNKHLGDDKILLVRNIKGRTYLFVIDGSKGEFEIGNKKFTAPEETIAYVQDISDALEDLVSGKVFKKFNSTKKDI